MQPLEFILAIIGMVFLFKLIKMRVNRNEQDAAAQADDERERLLDRLAQLEQRIEVLERIVTDQRADLHRQFEELRR